MPVGDRRREPRDETVRGTVRISGEEWRLRDWSRNGFSAMPCTAKVQVDDEIDIGISVPIPGRRLEFGCAAIIVRVDKEKNEIAGTYVEVDAATRAIIDWHFGVDSARIRNILAGAETAEQGVAMLSTIFPNLSTAEIVDLALDTCREQFEKVRITTVGLEAMEMVMERAPKHLETHQKLEYLAAQGDMEAAGLLFRLRGGVERRLSDQVRKAIEQALRQGRDDIAEQLLLTEKLILEQDAAQPRKRREVDKIRSRPEV